MDDRPLTAAGALTRRRPPAIPAKVRAALKLMVYGNDENCTPLDFISAARECGIRPDQMRRYLDRGNVRALLMQERRAFRAAICASNEFALLDVRNNSANGVARIQAVRCLEQLDEADTSTRPGTQQGPGVIVVINTPTSPVPQAEIVEVNPIPAPPDDPEPMRPRVTGPHFVPPRRW